MKLQFLRNGKTYVFNSTSFRYPTAAFPVYLTGTVGFGLAPSTQLTQRGPFQQGDTYVGFRLNPRVLQLPIVVKCSSIEDQMTKRATLSKIFRIDDDVVTVRMAWIDGTSYERSIDGRVVGGLFLDTTGADFHIRATVQIKANDPTWYDTYGTYTILSGTVAGTPTVYPKLYGNSPNGTPYGATAISKSTAIAYDGTWDAYPVIQATGPITDLVMVDTLGHQIIVNGTIAAGDTWTFNLAYGQYTVTDSAGANRFGSLAIGSDLVNWRIYAESNDVPDGLNTVSISGTGTDANSLVTMFFYSRYIGA